jgi:hypothetical protein
MLKYITYRFSDAERAKTTMFVTTLIVSAFVSLCTIVILMLR